MCPVLIFPITTHNVVLLLVTDTDDGTKTRVTKPVVISGRFNLHSQSQHFSSLLVESLSSSLAVRPSVKLGVVTRFPEINKTLGKLSSVGELLVRLNVLTSNPRRRYQHTHSRTILVKCSKFWNLKLFLYSIYIIYILHTYIFIFLYQ